jgi:hypothetical protein
MAVEPIKAIGARVLILNQRATVRYLGPVAGQQGDWVGVEYDDPARGKHDGVSGGVRYFSTRSGGPRAASLVRADKVAWGTSVLEALLARYNNERGEAASTPGGGGSGGGPCEEELYVRTAGHRRVAIQVWWGGRRVLMGRKGWQEGKAGGRLTSFSPFLWDVLVFATRWPSGWMLVLTHAVTRA